MRNGLTTGTCAALAAKAAALYLLEGILPLSVEVALPDGERITYPVGQFRHGKTWTSAAVMKDAGDDPDVTDKAILVVRVSMNNRHEISFFAGEGVGTVTRPGLAIPPGEPAINPVPRRQIAAALKEVSDCGFDVTISVPGGKELAAKTFNPRLGIDGGISILGTNGRVRPFSSPALKAALKCALDVAVAGQCRDLVLVPGHMGNRAARKHFCCSDEQIIDVSNEWGFVLDEMQALKLNRLLLLGHPGKLAKLPCGHFQTHSSQSPSPLPFLIGLAQELTGRAPEIELNTVEEFFMQWLAADQRQIVADALAEKIRDKVSQEFNIRAEIAVALIDLKGDLLGQTDKCATWLHGTGSF